MTINALQCNNILKNLKKYFEITVNSCIGVTYRALLCRNREILSKKEAILLILRDLFLQK
jgi:hypothetical protein